MSEKNDESGREASGVDNFFVDAEDGAYDEIVDSYKGDKDEMSLYDQDPPEEEAEASPEEEEADTSTETDEAELPSEEEEVAKEEVEEEENTVPLAALHEEREKRKALSRDLEDLKTKFRDLFDDYKKLSEEPAVIPPSYDGEEEQDPRFVALEKEVAQLKADRNKLASENKVTSQAKAAKKFDDQVSNADSDLEKNGYPGFKFSIATVDKILGEMVKDDPENRIYNNPEGWKKIYMEKVFPDIQAKFTTLDKTQIDEHKKALKKKAGLVGNPGKKGAPPKKDDEKSETELYEEYLSMRQTKGFS